MIVKYYKEFFGESQLISTQDVPYKPSVGDHIETIEDVLEVEKVVINIETGEIYVIVKP